MKTVYLLRHAKSSASDPSQDDHERPLNARGRDACARLSHYFAGNGIRPEAVLCSTSERTRETLKRTAAGLGKPKDVRFDETLYLASPQSILRAIAALDDKADSVLVVGHFPGIPDAALVSTGSDPNGLTANIQEKYPTGGFTRLSFPATRWQDLAPQTGTLDLFIRPRDLPDAP